MWHRVLSAAPLDTGQISPWELNLTASFVHFRKRNIFEKRQDKFAACILCRAEAMDDGLGQPFCRGGEILSDIMPDDCREGR